MKTLCLLAWILLLSVNSSLTIWTASPKVLESKHNQMYSRALLDMKNNTTLQSYLRARNSNCQESYCLEVLPTVKFQDGLAMPKQAFRILRGDNSDYSSAMHEFIQERLALGEKNSSDSLSMQLSSDLIADCASPCGFIQFGQIEAVGDKLENMLLARVSSANPAELPIQGRYFYFLFHFNENAEVIRYFTGATNTDLGVEEIVK